MPTSKPEWLDIVRHRVRGSRVPFLLVVQHHAIPATTRLVAPVSPSLPGGVDVLAPHISVDGAEYRARLLDMTAVPVALLGETVASLVSDRDAVLDAIDIILHGYPIGRPH
jgi:CcdB protein